LRCCSLEFQLLSSARAERLRLAEQGLDPTQVLGEGGDVGFGRVLFGRFQGEQQLAAGIEDSVVDLVDIISVLQAHSVFDSLRRSPK